VTDEFIEPAIIDKNGIVKSGDAIIFFNFRADRIRELTEAFFDPNFNGFARKIIPNLSITTMTQYDKRFDLPMIFESIDIKNTLADVMEGKSLTQLHIAETEKYPHVTYFFNGGREEPHRAEEQMVIPSPKVATYDLKPEMSAYEVTEKVISELPKNDFVLINYANGDMVGHTGSFKATVSACEVIDQCLGKLLATASSAGFKTIITADHGNCEVMINPANGEADKEHTTSSVPFVYLDFLTKPFDVSNLKQFSKEEMIQYSLEPVVGVLSDVAPTILSIMGMNKPPEMVGVNLIETM
jgi:2,3-bisphosphoglycerate-independent phosphoglycerate mutase